MRQQCACLVYAKPMQLQSGIAAGQHLYRPRLLLGAVGQRKYPATPDSEEPAVARGGGGWVCALDAWGGGQKWIPRHN